MAMRVRLITDSQGLISVMMLGLSFLAISLISIGVTAANTQFLASQIGFSTQQAAIIAADSYRGIESGFPCERARNFASQLDLNLVSCRIVNGVAEVELDKTHGLFTVSFRAFAE